MLAAILKLIEPLENEGVLVRRGRERIEMEIDHFYVMEHDNRTIGCAALYPFAKPKKWQNSPAWRLIRPIVVAGAVISCSIFVRKQAKELGFTQLFCLTTRTEHWFLERGFTEQNVNNLPMERQKLYNFQRKSKVFSKAL